MCVLLPLLTLPPFLFPLRMMKVKRVENTAWGTVDFIDPDANNDDSAVVFQTIPEVSRARKSQEKIPHFRPQATQETLPLRRQQKN